VPEVGIIAHELPGRYLCGKVVVIQVLDVEFYPRPPVIVFPCLFRRYIFLIMADNLVMPLREEKSLIIFVTGKFFDYRKFTRLFPLVETKGIHDHIHKWKAEKGEASAGN